MLRQREDVDHADVDARRHDQPIGSVTPVNAQRRQHAAERNHGKDRQGGGQDHDRRQDEQELVDVGRRVFFLEDELQTVGQRLQQSQRPDAVRPQPVLHPGGDPALEQHQIGRRGHQPPIKIAILTSGTIRPAASRGE